MILAEAAVGIGLGMVTAAAFWGHELPRHFGYYLALGAFLVGVLAGVRGVLFAPLAVTGYGVIKLVSAASGETGTGSDAYVFFIFLPALCFAVSLTGALARAVATALLGRIGGAQPPAPRPPEGRIGRVR